ncbi:MAG: acyl-[acyl-carrier-protein] thioesterase [Opitutales bacterium]
MDGDDAVFTHPITVRWGDTGLRGRLKPAAWLDFCMEAADAHARGFGFAMDDVARRGFHWVMLRYRLEFSGTAHARDELVVETWARGVSRLFARRDYRFRRADGTLLGRGTTAWLLVRQENFRPVRPETHLETFPMRTEVAYLEDTTAMTEADLAGGWTQTHRVERDEIDLLGHVSNPHYIRWAVEALPEDVWKQGRLAALDIDFLAMAFHGDAIEVRTAERPAHGEERVFDHELRRPGEVKVLTRLRTRWIVGEPETEVFGA